MDEKQSPFIEEEWRYITEKSVPNIVENKYLISNMGRIYSEISNKFMKAIPTNYKLENPYYRVALTTKDKKTNYYLIHRIVMIEFNYIENYNEMQVNHKYGGINQFFKGKELNCIWNLEWVTPSQNIQHAFDSGLKSQKHGEDCSYATITNAQAEQIAQLISEQKYSLKDIAKMVNVPLHTVANISSGNIWMDIREKYNLDQYKKEIKYKFSDEQLHLIFKYFQDNKGKYKILNDLYRHALKDLFNIDYANAMSATMSRLYNRQTRTNISNQYDF